MMCSLFLRDEKRARHGRLYLAIEGAFERILALYERGLDVVLRHQGLTLTVFFGTVLASVFLYVAAPKGFFPQQDTGIIKGLSDAAQDVSFGEMVRLQHKLADVVTSDPAVASYATFIGGSRPLNNGFVIIGLKPRAERKASADQIIRRLRRRLAQVQGATLYLQSAQDVNVGGRTARTQYQYTLEDVDLDELNQWAPKVLAKLRTLPQLQDVASDQQNKSTMLSMSIDRDRAARFGIQPALIDQTLDDAFGERQVAQYFTQLATYHVILEITPKLQADPNTLNRLYLKSPLTGQQVPLSSFVKFDTNHVGYLSINHQGQYPAVTLSFNLAPGVALGQAVDAIANATSDIHMPSSMSGSFQGTAQAFKASLQTEPYLILAALVVVYIVLGMLYESYIHPLTILSTLPSAGVGALLMLRAFHFELSVIALIGIILLIGIVKKNGIMMVDFALQAE
ncbi:MAG: efflux RND transporter permease subunit, partial [Burkholderiales bacterium]